MSSHSARQGDPSGDQSPLEAPKQEVRRKAAASAGVFVNRARERGRGRWAASPAAIPWRGWKDILLRVYDQANENRVVTLAAGVAFYSLLAIFPAIGALVAVYGLFNDPVSIAGHLDSLAGLFPDGALNVVRDELERLTSHRGGTLSIAFLIGLGTSLWSANAGIKSIFDALNLVYAEREKRGIIRINLISLAFTTAAILLTLTALGVMILLSPVLDHYGLTRATSLIFKIARWPVLFLAAGGALTVIYRYGPSRRVAQWRWVTPGSLCASLAWLAVSVGFSWYAAHFGSFDKTYGALGAVIGLMMWIWLSAIVVLLGAEIDAEMEHQTAHDTTEPGGKPLGERGATMADTIGAAQATWN